MNQNWISPNLHFRVLVDGFILNRVGIHTWIQIAAMAAINQISLVSAIEPFTNKTSPFIGQNSVDIDFVRVGNLVQASRYHWDYLRWVKNVWHVNITFIGFWPWIVYCHTRRCSRCSSSSVSVARDICIRNRPWIRRQSSIQLRYAEGVQVIPGRNRITELHRESDVGSLINQSYPQVSLTQGPALLSNPEGKNGIATVHIPNANRRAPWESWLHTTDPVA